MIGRASFGRPWIFKEVKHYIETGKELTALSFEWRLNVLRQEVLDSVNLLDERRGILHAVSYTHLDVYKRQKISRRSGIKTGAMNHYLHIIGKPESFFNGTIIAVSYTHLTGFPTHKRHCG